MQQIRNAFSKWRKSKKGFYALLCGVLLVATGVSVLAIIGGATAVTGLAGLNTEESNPYA